MDSTGDALAMLGALAVLGPLYGGAALLIREVAVATGRGWPGVALLATGFGLAMTGLIDMSLFGEHRSDVEGWSDLRTPTLVGAWGVSVAPLVGWVSGHVLMSVGAPLAVLHAAAPSLRRRRLLGRPGIAVVVLLFAVAALLIRMDAHRVYTPDPSPSVWQYVAVAAAVVVAIVLAFTRLGGSPSVRPHRRAPGVHTAFAAAFAVMLAYGLTGYSWWGVGATVAALAAAAYALWRATGAPGWGPRHVAAAAGAALVARTAVGVLSPVPAGVEPAAKHGQNAVLLAAVVALAWWIARRTEAEGARAPAGAGTPAQAAP